MSLTLQPDSRSGADNTTAQNRNLFCSLIRHTSISELLDAFSRPV
jgi:hypothetical protein